LLVISGNTLFSQNIFSPKYEKEELIPLIKDTTEFNVIFDIIGYNYIEATPYLEIYFKKQKDCFVKNQFLNALLNFGSQKTQSFALEYFDSVSSIQNSEYNYFEELIEIAFVLFEVQDYSRANVIIERVDTLTIINNIAYLDMLSSLTKSSEHVEWAKLKLKNQILNYNPKNTSRYLALYFYVLNFGEESLPIIKEVIQFDPDAINRASAFDELFQLDRSKETQQFILDIIPTEPDTLFKKRFAENLLDTLGTPYIYKTLFNYNDQKIVDLSFDFWVFRPIKPDSKTTIATMLDTLISYTNQSYSYGWITKKGIYNSLSKKLENTKKDLTKDKIKTAKNKLEAYKNEVDAQNGKHITENGYKFLYYFSTYIIERLQNGE
ncbi:MAG: hypothetical protein KKE09_11350, partial [Bacteroidetes bacterium]|nr:hypothetical protein [Bacteroidota bacterium]